MPQSKQEAAWNNALKRVWEAQSLCRMVGAYADDLGETQKHDVQNAMKAVTALLEQAIDAVNELEGAS